MILRSDTVYGGQRVVHHHVAQLGVDQTETDVVRGEQRLEEAVFEVGDAPVVTLSFHHGGNGDRSVRLGACFAPVVTEPVGKPAPGSRGPVGSRNEGLVRIPSARTWR